MRALHTICQQGFSCLDSGALLCDLDDFCLRCEPPWRPRLLPHGPHSRPREVTLTLSAGMTIEGAFHESGYRTVTDFSLRSVTPQLRWAFPRLVSYNRFVELMQQALIPLCASLQTRTGHSHGIAFMDSTFLAVCHPKRAAGHRVFAGIAGWGKNALGWCDGFKLHLLIKDLGEVLACSLTPANVDDRRPVPRLVRGLRGKIFGARGYISQALFETLFAHGVQLITKLRKDMKNKLLLLMDKLLLRKRSLIETVNDQLKNICQIEHSRHRSVANFLVNLVAGLIAYTYREKKPSLHLRTPQTPELSVLAL